MTLSSGTVTSPRPSPAVAMRAAAIDHFGAPMRIRHVPAPRPVLSEVLVRVMAAGVNPIDVKTSAGQGAAAGVTSWPAVLGSDFSGVVLEAPYEGFRLQPGDEVYGMTAAPRASGSFAEIVAVPAQHLALKPKVLSHTEAAAVPVAALTAWGAVVEMGKAHEGQRILIHAGAGGVGHFAVQLAAYFGAHVIATGSARSTGWLHELGAAETVDHTADRFERVVDEVDTVIDLIGDRGDRTGPRSLEVLRPGGMLVNVPSTSWPSLMADAAVAGVRATTFRVAPDPSTLAVLARLITSGDLRVAVQEVFPFERIAEALQTVEGGHVRGKVVVQVADY